MKNTLIIDMKTASFEVENMSSVNDGTDEFLLTVRCDSSKHVKLVNDLGTINVDIDADEYSFTFPKSSWIGLGSSTFTLSDDDKTKTYTISKTPACGGNYQITLTDESTIRFQKQKDIQDTVYDPLKETIVGTWFDGKPVYRKLLCKDKAMTIRTATYITISDLCIDTLVNTGILVKGTDGTQYPGQWPANPTSSNDDRIYAYINASGNLQLWSSSITGSLMTVWLEYTKTTDLPADALPSVVNNSELKNDWILIYEGGVRANCQLDLPESMEGHKFLACEVRNKQLTEAGFATIYLIPIAQLRTLYIYGQAVQSYYMMSQFDNYYDGVEYISDTSLMFKFGSTSYLTRMWYVD